MSSVLSTGPENIFQLWYALQKNDPDFPMELDEAGSNDEEGFFSYPFGDAIDSKKLGDIRGIGSLEPIFDGNNEKMHEILDEIVKSESENVPS